MLDDLRPAGGGCSSCSSLAGRRWSATLALLALLRDHSRPTVGEALRRGLVGLLPGDRRLHAAGRSALGSSLAVVLVADRRAGRRPVAGGADRRAHRRGRSLIYVLVKLSLSLPVIAIDKVHNPFTALARSWRLTKGNSFRLFLFYLLLFIVYLVIVDGARHDRRRARRWRSGRRPRCIGQRRSSPACSARR